MGKRKQVNYRAEQNRRRNQEEAAYRKKAKERKEFFDKHGKKITVATVAAIVAIVLIWLGCKWFISPGGSIPNFFGYLRGVEDNWIVSNLAENDNDSYYFKLAEFDAPEGYTLDPEASFSTDALARTQYYVADDENAAAASLYIAGVANKTAAAQVETLVGYGYTASPSGTVTIGGKEAQYAYSVFDTSEEGTADADKTGYASLCVYVDSVKDSCVLVLLNTATTAMADVPTEESLLAVAETIVPNLTIAE